MEFPFLTLMSTLEHLGTPQRHPAKVFKDTGAILLFELVCVCVSSIMYPGAEEDEQHFWCVLSKFASRIRFLLGGEHRWQEGVKTGLEVGPKRETCLNVYLASVLHFTAGRRDREKWYRGAEMVTAAASAPRTAPQFLSLYFFCLPHNCLFWC